MAYLYSDSLFANIPPDETIDFVSTTCTMATKIPLTFPIMIFIMCLTQSPKNHFLRLTTFIINKQMVQLWDLHWVQPQLTFLGVVLKVNGFKIAQMIYLKPVFYRRYGDDIFELFSSPYHADKFKEYWSSKHFFSRETWLFTFSEC